MRACGGDLQRALGTRLSADIGEIRRSFVVARRCVGCNGSGQQLAAGQMRANRKQAPRRMNHCISHQRSFLGACSR